MSLKYVQKYIMETKIESILLSLGILLFRNQWRHVFRYVLFIYLYKQMQHRLYAVKLCRKVYNRN